ncbi:MAG: response regulator [Oscillospiraceae bacterium]|jgi:two-component system chemotaxis response regulator CheY|nr:response regulator [Oscillospiraceae bacterium]
MKLLIVDDSSAIRKIIKAAADVLHMESIEACDGVEALEKVTESYESIDLVLLDWNMPEMSGYDVLVALKADEKYRHIPVMMVTTEGQKTSIVAAVKAGAGNYLTKPFSVEELESKILECIGGGSV